MTRRATHTKAAIRRAIEAAASVGVCAVEFLPDGTIRVVPRPEYELAAGDRTRQTGGESWEAST